MMTKEEESAMKAEDVAKLTSMPALSPVQGKEKFRCVDREFLIVDYETNIELLREVVPEPLQVMDNVVKFEVIRMPDFRGFGAFTESGLVIPVLYEGRPAQYVFQMYLDNFPAIAGGREIWGFPKKFAYPKLQVDADTLLGTCHYGQCEVARATMAYKWQAMDKAQVKQTMENTPGLLLKIIPDVDNTPMIVQLVKYGVEDLVVKEAWSGPAGLALFDHVHAPMARLPVRKVLKGYHIIVDMTLSWGTVVYDYAVKHG
jgi:acetoacetate decarboxylase